MDIRQLKFFLAVVDHHGFSRAAALSLAMSTALSSLSAGITLSTGPKISSCAMTCLLSTPQNAAGSM